MSASPSRSERPPDHPRRIALGADHAGYLLKDLIAMHLDDSGYVTLDLGTNTDARVDYPDFGEAVGHAVASGEADLGIAVCGSGIGIGIAANKVRGVRAAVAHDATSARLAREHNDANVLCLGERLIGVQTALDAIDAWLGASFEGGRHQGRIDKIDRINEVDARLHDFAALDDPAGDDPAGDDPAVDDPAVDDPAVDNASRDNEGERHAVAHDT